MMATEGDKRVAILTSKAAHTVGVWDPNNLQGENGYGALKFYANSKLYNVCVYVCLCVFMCVCVCLCVFMCAHMCVFVYTSEEIITV